MPDRFSESGTKMLQSMNVYKKPGKQPIDTTSCQNNFITRSIFSYLPSCQAINQLRLHWSYPIIKAQFGSVSYRITMFTRETNGMDCTVSIFVPLADAEQSVSDSYRAV